MKRLAWATDVHFEFAGVDKVVEFCERVIALEPDGLLLTGDIAQAHSIERYLKALDRALPFPLYFVLGNHDYYYGSIPEVRAAVSAVVAASSHLTWMSSAGVVSLSKKTALIGHDGWADGRFGDFGSSGVLLNDYRLIEELKNQTREERLVTLNALGDEAADHFRRVLPEALARHRKVVALTHVPPFAEAAWYQGRISDPQWLPHFSSRALGEAIVEIMDAHPDRELTVLCGHTHAGGAVQIRPNVRVVVGWAEYGNPAVQEVLEVP
jgi:3',5'-cyclic AMP phosphodiesterase CpdA